MNILYLKQSEDTPLIHFNPNTGEFTIKGNSLPENINLFYDPVLEWLDKYIENPASKTCIKIQMKMISSASSKMFFDILGKIDLLNENTKSVVKVSWLYSIYDDEIREIGLDYKDIMNVPFEVVLTNSK